MKIDVNFEACHGHGECVVEAPGVFDLAADSDIVVVLDDAPAEDQRPRVERAVAMCPVAALKVVG